LTDYISQNLNVHNAHKVHNQNSLFSVMTSKMSTATITTATTTFYNCFKRSILFTVTSDNLMLGRKALTDNIQFTKVTSWNSWTKHFTGRNRITFLTLN